MGEFDSAEKKVQYEAQIPALSHSQRLLERHMENPK